MHTARFSSELQMSLKVHNLPKIVTREILWWQRTPCWKNSATKQVYASTPNEGGQVRELLSEASQFYQYRFHTGISINVI